MMTIYHIIKDHTPDGYSRKGDLRWAALIDDGGCGRQLDSGDVGGL
jgi:hypothetical protein